jgi:hypothetical protein
MRRSGALKEQTFMDHYESDRMLTNELKDVLFKLRDENKKLKEGKNGWIPWALGAVVAILLFALLSGGGGSGHYYHRY